MISLFDRGMLRPLKTLFVDNRAGIVYHLNCA